MLPLHQRPMSSQGWNRTNLHEGQSLATRLEYLGMLGERADRSPSVPVPETPEGVLLLPCAPSTGIEPASSGSGSRRVSSTLRGHGSPTGDRTRLRGV